MYATLAPAPAHLVSPLAGLIFVLLPPFLAAISSPCAAVDLAGSSGRNSFSSHPLLLIA
jgi:hypothetical protein